MLQSNLIAFIDDASRLVVHGEFFPGETATQLVATIRSAFYKRGIPEQMYDDNGSIYAGQILTLLCRRVGCILRHTPLRDGAAKGKIERFFRTVRDSFLSRILDHFSFGALNRLFSDWLENDYNASVHSAIGMKPIDRFALDIKRVRFLPSDQVTDEIYYAEETRKVKRNNTFCFDGKRFEAPATLHDREIHIRFDRFRKGRVIVYYKGLRQGNAKRLDLVTNGILRNQKLQQMAAA